MGKRWMPITAGVLDILVGGLSVFFLLVLWWSPNLWPFFWLAILAIVGGMHALGRNEWSVALAGSVSAFLFLLASSFGPKFVLNGSRLIPLPVGIVAVIFTVLSKKEFQSEPAPALRPTKRLLAITSGILIIASGLLQVGISLYVIWPVIIGEAAIGRYYYTPGPNVDPQYVFYTLPWSIISIIAIVLGSISIVRPEERNLALLGAIAALIPLGMIATYYLVYGPIYWALVVLVGIAALVLTALSRKQFERK